MEENNESINYANDSRVPCKYGLECYQKNKTHHEKFKHPPKTKPEPEKEKHEIKNDGKRKPANTLTNWLKRPPNKKQKTEEKTNDSANFSFSKDANNETKSPIKERIKEKPNDLANSSSSTEDIKAKHDESKKLDDFNNEINDKIEEPDKDEDNEINKSCRNISSISLVPLMDVKEKIKKFFLVNMPDDFYQFWEFCEEAGSGLLAKGNPLDALKNVGLTLVGPFDVLAGKFNDNIVYEPSALLRHYRYYYDVPEFQTVIKGNEKTGYHMGYFRDDPKENPVFVASNCAEENGIIKPVAENLFGAVNIYLDDFKKTADTFVKMKIVKLKTKLIEWAEKNNITLSKSTAEMKKREAKVLTRTFHKAGLVVPYNKKTEVGYRELAESDATIKGILSKIANSSCEEERTAFFSKLYPIINFANIANDECDFGTPLELGLDLFTYGSPLVHETIKRLTGTAYNLLGRQEFAEIMEAHLKDRKKGSNLSILRKS